jgi:PST family polysaccharide transporter
MERRTVTLSVPTIKSRRLAANEFLNRIQAGLRGRFARNIGWMGIAQVVNRVFRLAATIVAARLLLPEDYGLAAIVLAAHEFSMIVAQRATSTSLVQSNAEELEGRCASAWSLNWLVCMGLFVGQCVLALVLARFYDNSTLALPLCALALSFLMLPLGMVQAALNVRAGRLSVVAKVDAMQSVADALLTVMFALSGVGVWALILPKVLLVPLWVTVHRRSCSWRCGQRPAIKYWGELFKFGRNVVGVNLLTVVRNNADYVLIGKFLGVEALGIYYFAFNAGMGISLGVINAFSAAMLPHLCSAGNAPGRLKGRFKASLGALALVVGSLVLLQTFLAPVYVPMVFGQRWVDLGAVPILILICLSAIPRALGDAVSQLLHATAHPGLDFKLNLVFTISFVGAVFVAVPHGLEAVAGTVLGVMLLAVPLIAVLAWRRVFGVGQAIGISSELARQAP